MSNLDTIVQQAIAQAQSLQQRAIEGGKAMEQLSASATQQQNKLDLLLKSLRDDLQRNRQQLEGAAQEVARAQRLQGVLSEARSDVQRLASQTEVASSEVGGATDRLDTSADQAIQLGQKSLEGCRQHYDNLKAQAESGLMPLLSAAGQLTQEAAAFQQATVGAEQQLTLRLTALEESVSLYRLRIEAGNQELSHSYQAVLGRLEALVPDLQKELAERLSAHDEHLGVVFKAKLASHIQATTEHIAVALAQVEEMLLSHAQRLDEAEQSLLSLAGNAVSPLQSITKEMEGAAHSFHFW